MANLLQNDRKGRNKVIMAGTGYLLRRDGGAFALGNAGKSSYKMVHGKISHEPLVKMPTALHYGKSLSWEDKSIFKFRCFVSNKGNALRIDGGKTHQTLHLFHFVLTFVLSFSMLFKFKAISRLKILPLILKKKMINIKHHFFQNNSRAIRKNANPIKLKFGLT